SDLDYYLDFERDITQTTSPTVFSHIDLARNWSNYSLNARVDRQEQFLSSQEDLTLQRLPELELRGRGIRFGRSPFYLSFEASAGLFDRNRRLDVPRQPADPNNPEDTVSRRQSTTYQRYDLFPTIAASFSPTPWLDVSPSVSARETIYTRSLADPLDPNSPTSADDITREFAAFNLSLVGPRFFRVFGDIHRTDLPIRKHTFEPQVKYTYIPEVSDGENVIRFDEVDTLTGVRNEVTYSLISRLFTRAAASVAPPPPTPPTEPYASDITGPTQIQAPVTDLKDLPSELKEALKDSQRAAGVGAVEVATFDLSQTYSLDADRPRSVATPVQPDGTPERLDSQAGPVVASVRYNPTSAVSFDLRTSYDILFDDIKNVSLSANLRSLQHGYMRFSWFLERDFEGRFVDPNGRAADPNAPVKGDALRFFDSSQVRLIGGTSFFDRKITLDLEGSYDIENRNLLDQRYRLGYNTQCCGMLVEIARRDFDTIDEVEYRFVLNLRGVGTFLDLQGRPR
ncbi:MAG TPA: LPS assembly protein LptD, partial [Candidatus Polarisedimenticolia bacterium]|nr:LPS assembly protein LptD [Candidatus Polarisedimenticolia bacterium]